MRPESGFRITANSLKTRKMIITSQFADMTLSLMFFNVSMLLLSSLVTGSSFMSISLPVLELGQFLFIRD